MSTRNKMDPKTFPDESYESARPQQSQEQQKLALLHREKRQESTAEVLKKANAIIQKSKNSKNQQGNLAEFSNSQAGFQEKNVDDTISDAKTPIKYNTYMGNDRGDSYQNPAEIQMQSRGDRIRGERNNKNTNAAQEQKEDEEEGEGEYTSIFNVKIQPPTSSQSKIQQPTSSQSKLGPKPIQEYSSIFDGANLAIANATTPMTHQSQDGFEEQNESVSYQDQTNRSFNSESIRINNTNQEPESSLIGKMTPHKLSVTPSKQQYVERSSSKKEIIQQQTPSSSSKMQASQISLKENKSEYKFKQQQGQVSQPAQNQDKINNQKKNKPTYDNSADYGQSSHEGDAGAATQSQAQKGQNRNNIYTEKEISQMRAMLLRRKRERIRRNAGHIIYFHLQRYMQREQNKKQHYLMVEFIHHCAHMIQRAARRFLTRRQEKRNALLGAVAIGWRIRRIIRLPKLMKISNDIKSMEQEKALFPEDAEGNQGIEEEISREKVNYCNSLRALQVRGKWLSNLNPDKNQDKSSKQVKKQQQQQQRPLKESREQNHYEPLGRETHEEEGQFDSRNHGADSGRGRQQQRDTTKQYRNIQQQQQQQYGYAEQSEEEYARQRQDDRQEMEDEDEEVDYVGSQKMTEKQQQFRNKSSLNSSLNNTINKNTSFNNNNNSNSAKNFNHAWDDIPVGGNKQKKLNDTLKGWEDAYPAEQQLDSNQRELVENKGKIAGRVQKTQNKDGNARRKEQLEKQKVAEDKWDEQPIGGHMKKRMEQNWEEFPEDGQQQRRNEKQIAAKNQEDEKEKERLREERVKRKEQRDQSEGGDVGSAATAAAAAPGAKKIDKDKLDNLKKRTKYDPRKAIVEAKNKQQQNQDANEGVKQQSKREAQATGVSAKQKQHHEDEEEGQVPNEEDDYRFDGDEDNGNNGQQKNKQIKAASPERKQQSKYQAKQKGRQQTSQQREGSQQKQQEENEPQQGSNKEQKPQLKKEFLKKKPKVIEFQKLNWKNVKSKTNTGRQEQEQKAQLFSNNFQNQQQQLRYIDELNNENMVNPQGQYTLEQEQQLPPEYTNQQNNNNNIDLSRARPQPQQNLNAVHNLNPNNFASSHNQFVTYEHFQQQQANHPNNSNNNALNRRNNQQQQQQQYIDSVHPNQIIQQQGSSPKGFTEQLPNKTSQKALSQLAQNQAANQEIIIRPAMFKNKASQQQQPQQGIQQLSNGFIDHPEIGQIPHNNKKQNTNAGVPDLDRMRQNKKESLLNQQQQQYNQQQQQHNQFVQDYQQRVVGDYASQQQQQQQQQQMQEEQQQMPFMYPTPYRSSGGKSGIKQINLNNNYQEYAISHNPVRSNSTIQELLMKKQEQFMNYGFQ